MKKIIIGIALSLFTFTTASAELGVNVGISAATGLFGATGKEVQTDADGTEGTQTQKKIRDHAGKFWFYIYREKLW